MQKDKFISIALESFNADNRSICENNGMSEDKIKESIDQSQQAIIYMLGNVYDKIVAEKAFV